MYYLVIKERKAEAGSGITEKCLVAMRPGETPVPIPNTMVKTRAAENTLLETAREDRWLPDIQRKINGSRSTEVDE